MRHQCHFEPYELYYCERTRFHEPLCEFPLIVLHITSQRVQITLATTMLAPFVLFRFSIALFWCHHFIFVLYRTQLEPIIHVGILWTANYEKYYTKYQARIIQKELPLMKMIKEWIKCYKTSIGWKKCDTLLSSLNHSQHFFETASIEQMPV